MRFAHRMGRKGSEPLEFVGFRRNYHADFGSSSGKSRVIPPGSDLYIGSMVAAGQNLLYPLDEVRADDPDRSDQRPWERPIDQVFGLLRLLDQRFAEVGVSDVVPAQLAELGHVSERLEVIA